LNDFRLAFEASKFRPVGDLFSKKTTSKNAKKCAEKRPLFVPQKIDDDDDERVEQKENEQKKDLRNSNHRFFCHFSLR